MGLIPRLSVTGAKTLAATLLLVFVWQLFEVSFALAQGTTVITPTTGVGDLSTKVMPDGKTILITGGTRPGTGENLFHSFHQFNVGRGDTAQFLNTTPSLPTSNILGRVTGGNPSSIFGSIDTMSYSGANLFLMNPAGIVFGPSATLNVSGSVAFTTADYLRLAKANGTTGLFHANPGLPNVLTSTPVAAFGFLGSNPVAIAVQGSTLEMKPGHSISLVGGNQGFDLDTGASASIPNGVTMTGAKLMAQSGRVNIASVASPGEIVAEALNYVPNVNGQSFGALGTIQVSQQSTIESGVGGGTILIRGGRLVVDTSTISANTGDIFLDATSIGITGTRGITGTQTQIVTGTESTANAGRIILSASGNIKIDSNVLVWSASGGSSGNAGNITVRSSQGNINFTNEASITSQAFDGRGNSGSIEIDAPHGDILLADSSVFNSVIRSTGTIGGIRINANNLHLLKGSRIDGDNFSAQAAGNIAIMLAGRLDLTGGSEIETGATGLAAAADLIIRARDILIADGSQLSADTTSSSSGAGGGVSIRGLAGPSNSVTVDGPGSGIFIDTKGIGPGGAINLSARSLTIENGGEISAETSGTAATATGGSITVTATDQVKLINGASITASSIVDPKTPKSGIANAGNILINAGRQLELLDRSSITTTTQSTQANGGDIKILATDLVRLVNKSEISTSVKGAEGSGGNIFIDPKVVILQGSNVTAQAVGGAGGNITFVTPLFLADSTAKISASSERGPSGTVNIQSPTSNLSGTVGQLTAKTSPAQVLLQNRCVALAGGQESTFIVSGRDALPTEPGGWLSSPVSLEHWTGEEKEHASGLMVRSRRSNAQPPMVMSQDEPSILSLRRLTPSGFLVRSLATAPTGCRS